MNWTMDHFLQSLKEQTKFEREQKLSAMTDQERLQYTKDALLCSLGEMPSDNCILSPILIDKAEYEDYDMEQLHYTSMPHVEVPVIVLTPKGERPANGWPVVLACHGHGKGQYDALGMDASGQVLANKGIHNEFALQLVRQGVAVVIPEIMGFGVRRMERDLKDPTLSNSCAILAAQLLANGRTLAGMRVYEARRAIDYIVERPDLNEQAIGIFGLSGGAKIAAYTAVLDERICATVLCGWVNTYADSILAVRHCIDNYLPQLLQHAEQVDVLRLIAPRPLYVEHGKKDHIFPIEATEKVIALLQEQAAYSGRKERFDYHVHEGAHEIEGTRSIPWLIDRLKEIG